MKDITTMIEDVSRAFIYFSSLRIMKGIHKTYFVEFGNIIPLNWILRIKNNRLISDISE